MAEGNVDVNEALKTRMAGTIALGGDMYLNLADYQSRVFLRLESQTDIIDAHCAQQIGQTNLPAHIAGLNTGAQAPQRTLG